MANKVKGRNLVYWLCQTLGWGIYTVIGILLAIATRGGVQRLSGAWIAQLVFNYVVFFVTIVVLTHLLRLQIHRGQWLLLPMSKAAPRLIAGTIAVGALAAAQVIGLDAVSLGALQDRPAMISVSWGLIGLCGVWTVLYVVIVRDRDARAMAEHLREAQLRALEAQVNPHFLFNSLNTVRGMIVEDAAVAQDMVTRLANILRYSLQRDRSSTSTLEREMEIVSDYLAIESIRFDDRLRVRIEIQPAAAQAQVPSMLMQTLVENAVKHGIGNRTEGGEIVIRASILNGALAMEVVNSGQLSAPKIGATQIGLKNARERLRLLYGGRAQLQLENRDAGTVAARVSIPA